MAAAAAELGVSGKNPARTYQRWETGQSNPPLAVVLKLKTLSNGLVDIGSWRGAYGAADQCAEEKSEPIEVINERGILRPDNTAARASASSPDPIVDIAGSPPAFEDKVGA